MIELNFSDKKKPLAVVRRNDPIAVFRAALKQQLCTVVSAQQNETLTVSRRRYSNGKPTTIDVPVRQWWWIDDDAYFLTLRYSSQIIRIRDHETINCGGTLNDVQSVLQRIMEALDEEDEDVMAALNTAYERTRWKKHKNV